MNKGLTKDYTKSIKGIAIIMMIFHHMFRTPSMYKGFSVSFYPFPESMVNNILTYFKLCVGTYAFLSGYGLTKSWKNEKIKKKKESLSSFFITRYVKTFFSFWIVFILSNIVCQIIDGFATKVYLPKGLNLTGCFNILIGFLGLGRIFTLDQLCYEWWYMSAYIVFILLTPILYENIKKHGAMAVGLVIVILPRIFGISFMGGTWPLSFVMPVFLGIVCENSNVFEKISEKKLFQTSSLKIFNRLFASFILLWISYHLYMNLSFELYWEVMYGVVPMLAVISFYLMLSTFPYIFVKVLMFFGEYSMGIYLTHTIIRTYLKKYLYSIPHFIPSSIALLLISLIVSIFVEKISNKAYSFLKRRLFDAH